MKRLSDLLLSFMAGWDKGEPAKNEREKIHVLLKEQKAYHQAFLFLSAVKGQDRKRAFLASLTEDWEDGHAILLPDCK
jgi:hypothetical protein